MKKFIIAASALALAPALASAQELGGLDTLLANIGELITTALPIVVALALLAFFWGLVRYIFAAGNEEAKAEGKRIMLWGIIALFVMVSVWGLVIFVGELFGIDQGEGIDVPTVPL